MISKTRRVSAKEAVITALESYISENGLKPGDSLPTEAELSNGLNVSRSVLREGLQYFRTLGIIGTKPKRGAFIKRLAPENPFGGYLTFMRGDKRKIKEISQMRMIVELGIIPFLIETATEDQIDELEVIAKGMEDADPQTRSRLDVEFHTAMLRILGNELVNGLTPFIVDFFDEITVADRKKPGKTGEDIALEHLAIAGALREGNSSELPELIRGHYATYL